MTERNGMRYGLLGLIVLSLLIALGLIVATQSSPTSEPAAPSATAAPVLESLAALDGRAPARPARGCGAAVCPCALSLATPTALTSATAHLTRSGILLRRGHVLDVLTRANRIVMDKTGTLTTGNISLVGVQPLAELGEDECLAIARALEAYSEHPIARAFRSQRALPMR